MDLQDLRSSWMTICLLVAILIVFAIQGLPVTMPKITSLLQDGANFNPYSSGSQPWRILFSIFMHGGLIHLIVNASALFILGSTIENRTGPFYLLLLFLFTGIIANIASLQFNYFTVSVGASGAIFGLFGFHSANELWFHRKQPELFVRSLVLLCIYLFVMVSLGNFLPFDNAAHIGGFVCGASIALLSILIPFFRQPLSLLALLPIAILLWLRLPENQRKHFYEFQDLASLETKFRNTDYDSDNDAIEANDKYAQTFDSLSLLFRDSLDITSEPLILDRAFLSELASVHASEARFMSKLIREETYRYLDSIELMRAFPYEKLNYPLLISDNSDDVPEQEEASPLTRVFYDSSWTETSARNAVYYRLGYKDSLNRWNGRVEDYFLNGSIQMKGFYSSGLKDGIFRYYNSDSSYDAVGRYENEYRTGKWEFFHKNGQLSQVIIYEDKPYLRSAYDSQGNAQVTNGEGNEIQYYSNGIVRAFMPYRQGLRDGRAYGLYPDGSPKYQERYENGRFILGESYLGEKTIQYDVSSFYPSPKDGFTAFTEYIQQRLNAFPEHVDDSSVRLLFDCTSTGEIHDIRVLKSAGWQKDSIAIAWLRRGPSWKPALIHGLTPAASEGVIDISFSKAESQ